MKLQLKISDDGVIEDAQLQDLRLRQRDRQLELRDRAGEGQDGRRGDDDQEHADRRGAVAAAGEDPLLGARRGRASRRRSPTGRSASAATSRADSRRRRDASMAAIDRQRRRRREKIHALVAEKGMPEAGLRVKVVGGGCSGLHLQDGSRPAARRRQGLRARRREADRRSQELSLPERHRARLQRRADGVGLQPPAIPNVKRTCGCGSSFAV